MTVSLNWVITLPPNISADKFDSWYLGTHTKYGKASAHILRYVVNRAYATQPRAAVGIFIASPRSIGGTGNSSRPAGIRRLAMRYWATDWSTLDSIQRRFRASPLPMTSNLKSHIQRISAASNAAIADHQTAASPNYWCMA